MKKGDDDADDHADNDGDADGHGDNDDDGDDGDGNLYLTQSSTYVHRSEDHRYGGQQEEAR